MYPVVDLTAARALGATLRRVGYTEDAVHELLGEDAYAAGDRHVPVHARRLPETRLGAVVRALFLALPVTARELGDAVAEPLVRLGFASGGGRVEPFVRAVLRCVCMRLALTSALLVAGLGRQMRLLAREAMRRRQEAEREAADAKIAREGAEREELRAAFLASAGQELTASLDFKQTVNMLARLVVPNLAEICAIDLLEGDRSLRRVATAHRDAEKAQVIAANTDTILADTPDVLLQVMRERQARVALPPRQGRGGQLPGVGGMRVQHHADARDVLGGSQRRQSA